MLTLGVLHGVLNPYVVGLEEFVKLKAGLDAEKPLLLGLRDAVVLVLFRHGGLRSAARQIAARRCQPAGKLAQAVLGVR